MTQREVANKCGWSTNYINAIINGKKGCNEETMLKIKQYYPDLQFKKIIKIRYKVDKEKKLRILGSDKE